MLDIAKIDKAIRKTQTQLLKNQNEDGSWGDITEKSNGNYKNTLISFEAIKDYVPSKQREKVKN